MVRDKKFDADKRRKTQMGHRCIKKILRPILYICVHLRLIPFISALFLTSTLFAQQYKIASVNYNAEGLTKESALKRNIKIEEGKTFENIEALDSYIVEIKQRLINARLFETIQVEYTVIETDAETETEGTPILVTINVDTVDSKHFLVLPYPKYDSNEGFEIKAKIKDDNFLGTMSELSGDAFFQFENKPNQDKDYILGGSLKYNLPFTIGKVEASWNNNLSFEYAFVRDEPEWNLKTGFTFILPLKNLDLRLDLTQGTTRDLEYKKFDDELYFTEHAKFSVPIRLETIEGFGDIVYTPAVQIIANWDKDGINDLNEDLVSPELTFSHGVSAGRINWQGNFRKGVMVSLTQTAGYNFQLNEFQPGVEARLLVSRAWKYVGFNSRFTAFAEFNSYKKFGQFLRGIPDDQYFAEGTGKGDFYACKSAATMVLNLDFPIRLFATNWEKVGWHKFKSLNFELQLSPFIDIALTQNRVTGRVFDPRDGFYTCGMEILVFPEKWRSIQIRASIGFDMSRLLFKNAVDTSWRDEKASTKEISIGIGLFY